MAFYYIENQVPSESGKRLALTFSAEGKAVAVSTGSVPVARQQVHLTCWILYVQSNDYSKWLLEGFSTTSQTTVVPGMDKTLEVWQKDIDNVAYVATIPADKYVWTFKDTGDGWECVLFLLANPPATF
jgi:hypothetical protein